MRARSVLGGLAAAACLTAVAAGGAGAQPPSVLPLIPAPALAYTTGSGTAYVWRAGVSGGPAQRLGKGEQPLIAANGLVAAAHSGESGPALTVYGGARPLSLFSLRSVSAAPLAWSGEGRYLAVALTSTRLHPRIADSSVVVVDTQTGRPLTVGHGYPCGASFAPGSALRLVFGLAGSTTSCNPGTVDLFVVTAGVPRATRLTHDRRSTDPVWGRKGIIFTRLTARRNTYPAAQLWLRPARGGAARQLTHVRVDPLVSGLYADGVSADGNRVLATFAGQDTDEAWTFDLRSRRLRRLTVHGVSIIPGSISSDGAAVLATAGDPFGPPSVQTVVSVPFSGGPASVLVRHAGSATWNR